MTKSHPLRFTSEQMEYFRERARKYLKSKKCSPVTLSKKLFRGSASTLPGILEGSISPQFKNMVEADEALSALLSAQIEAAQ